MEFSEPITFIYIPFPRQAQFRFNYKFHKMIPVISIFNLQKLSYFEIIRFLVNLGFIAKKHRQSQLLNSHLIYLLHNA